MIVAGSSWTSDQIDLSILQDGSEPDISAWVWEVTYFTRPGDGGVPVDDYGSTNGTTIPYLLRKSDSSGVAVDDEAQAIIRLVLTQADTETIRTQLGRDVWKPRLLTIQLRRTETGEAEHILFQNDMFIPGGGS